MLLSASQGPYISTMNFCGWVKQCQKCYSIHVIPSLSDYLFCIHFWNMLTFCIFQRSTASSSKFISDLILYVVQDLSIKIKLNKEVRFTHPLKLYYCHQKTVLLRGTNISHLLTCHLLIFIYETRFLTWKNCLISQYSICYRTYLQRWVRKNI